MTDAMSAVTHVTDQLYSDDTLQTIDEQLVVGLIQELPTVNQSEEVSNTSVMDLLIALIARRPVLMTGPVLDEFVSYYLRCNALVRQLIGARHLAILSDRCPTPVDSWNKYETVILKMLAAGVTTAAITESDCLATLKHQWSDPTLQRFASCMKSVAVFVRQHALSDKSQEMDESEAMEWMSWLCSQSDH